MGWIKPKKPTHATVPLKGQHFKEINWPIKNKGHFFAFRRIRKQAKKSMYKYSPMLAIPKAKRFYVLYFHPKRVIMRKIFIPNGIYIKENIKKIIELIRQDYIFVI
jgi:hypothetical protein